MTTANYVPTNDDYTWTTTIQSILHIPNIFAQTDRHKYTQQQTKQDTPLKSDAKSVRYGVFSF